MHNIFMPDRGSLVELFVDGSAANRHFHNLAFWAGHAYQGSSMANPLPTARLEAMVETAIQRLDLSSPLR